MGRKSSDKSTFIEPHTNEGPRTIAGHDREASKQKDAREHVMRTVFFTNEELTGIRD